MKTFFRNIVFVLAITCMISACKSSSSTATDTTNTGGNGSGGNGSGGNGSGGNGSGGNGNGGLSNPTGASVQCIGTTQKGERCKNKTNNTNSRCHLHQ